MTMTLTVDDEIAIMGRLAKAARDRHDQAPRLGQRVRFTRTDHVSIKHGTTGMIELISDREFWVLADEGGFFGWTSFDSWEPTGEPDVELPPDYVAMRQERPR